MRWGFPAASGARRTRPPNRLRRARISYENCVLTEYTGTKTRIHPHLTVSKEPVVGLGDGVFKDSQTIEYFSVAHNDEFTTIGAEAFMNSSLREVDLFDSVTTIGARAFANCAQLEALTLPDSLTTIGEGALDGLTGLKKLVIKCDPGDHPRRRVRKYAHSERRDRRNRR